MELGELGVVGFLRFYNVERNDTARYSCVAVNELPETTRLRNESRPVQLTVLGKFFSVGAVYIWHYTCEVY